MLTEYYGKCYFQHSVVRVRLARVKKVESQTDRSKHDKISEKITIPVLLIYVVLHSQYVFFVCFKTVMFTETKMASKYTTRGLG